MSCAHLDQLLPFFDHVHPPYEFSSLSPLKKTGMPRFLSFSPQPPNPWAKKQPSRQFGGLPCSINLPVSFKTHNPPTSEPDGSIPLSKTILTLYPPAPP